MDNPFKTNKRPFVIAGPCSAESPEQLSATVKSLTKIPDISLIRCGIWKPRTRPGGFEGHGEQALRWIQDIRKTYPATEQPRFCCEVARPEHVSLALRYGIDAVWIGARTTVNPFMVGEIAESLKGCHMAVMVKNPISPDVRLWIGAIERIRQSGITSIAAIHRGFYTYNDKSGYRNNPIWEVPLELRKEMPEIPILCDPSHIGGRRELILPIMQTAANMGVDGYMIECHHKPEDALTDPEQQITPVKIQELLSNIKERSNIEIADEQLSDLRRQIDQIDAEIIHQLSQRMQISKEIAQIKTELNLTIFQPNRYRQVVEQRIALAESLGLSPKLIKDLYEKIHAESVKIQEQGSYL